MGPVLPTRDAGPSCFPNVSSIRFRAWRAPGHGTRPRLGRSKSWAISHAVGVSASMLGSTPASPRPSVPGTAGNRATAVRLRSRIPSVTLLAGFPACAECGGSAGVLGGSRERALEVAERPLHGRPHGLGIELDSESGPRLAREVPHLKLVVDHFGWPTDLSDTGLRVPLRQPPAQARGRGDHGEELRALVRGRRLPGAAGAARGRGPGRSPRLARRVPPESHHHRYRLKLKAPGTAGVPRA